MNLRRFAAEEFDRVVERLGFTEIQRAEIFQALGDLKGVVVTTFIKAIDLGACAVGQITCVDFQVCAGDGQQLVVEDKDIQQLDAGDFLEHLLEADLAGRPEGKEGVFQGAAGIRGETPIDIDELDVGLEHATFKHCIGEFQVTKFLGAEEFQKFLNRGNIIECHRAFCRRGLRVLGKGLGVHWLGTKRDQQH